MSTIEKLNVGLVGAVGRGGDFRRGFEANGTRIHAVCDTQSDKLEECRQRMGAEEKYSDYAEMLDKSRIDAVVVGTPMPFHAPMSIQALQRGLHVMSEVTAAVSLDEARSLVRACRSSSALYMMAENYTYMWPNVIIRELVGQGLFGQPYFAEAEYLHELKGLNEITRWRRQWQTGINGITYGTHSLGPILQWMPGDRVTSVSCVGSGRRHSDPRGLEYENEATCMMLCKTARNALIKVRVDMLSDRPHAMTNYQLQGTDGCYESGRGGPCDRPKIWLRALSRGIKWTDFESFLHLHPLADRFVPDIWRNPPPEALRAGHGGGDYFEVRDFVRAIRREAPCPIGIHEAMDMTLPGLVSQQSILEEGRWLPVPDSRDW
jgi:predicted dehydrogenase